MDDATHAVMPPDPEMIQVGDAIWQRPQWRGQVQSAVRPVGVAEVLELPQHHHQVAQVPDQGPVLWRSKIGSYACELCLLGFQAARTYSLIRPLRTGFRRIWRVGKSPCGDAGRMVLSVGDALVEALVRAGGVVAAPRGAALYRPRSGQGREEMSLDLMADPGSER